MMNMLAPIAFFTNKSENYKKKRIFFMCQNN